MPEKDLLDIGFTQKEAGVYLAVLSLGKATTHKIARIAKVSRTTCYSILDNLEQKGIIAFDDANPVRYIYALPPKNLEKIVEKEELKLQDKKELVRNISDNLSNLFSNAEYKAPKVTFVEEIDVTSFLKSRMPEWVRSAEMYDRSFWGFQDHSFVEHYADWIRWAYKRLSKNKVRLLGNDTPAEKQIADGMRENRFIKFWKNEANFTASTWVVGDYLVLVQTRNRPHYIVEINDKMIAHNQREVFKTIWKDVA